MSFADEQNFVPLILKCGRTTEKFIEHQKSEGCKRVTFADDRTRLGRLCVAMGHLKVGDIIRP